MSDKPNSSPPEYRLVRIQEHPGSSPHDPVDLRELAGEVHRRSRIVWWSVGVCIALGLFIALGSESSYDSHVRIMPEAHQPSGLGAIGGIARQFGISALPDGTMTEGIPPDLYPDITRSIVIMRQIMDFEVEVPGEDRHVTVYEYFTDIKKTSPVGFVTKYTVGLPFTILRGIRKMTRDEEVRRVEVPPGTGGTHFDERRDRIIRMSFSEWELLEELQNRVSAEMSLETGAVSVSVSMPDPDMAADIADRLVELLTEYITDYRTEKARRDVVFVEERYQETRQRFEDAQERLARFRDENRGQLTELARTREQRLQSEYDLAFNLYNAMAERLEDARIKLQEDTPVVTVLEPAAVPVERSWPKRAIIMIASVFIGLLVGVVWILGARAWLRSGRV